MAALAHSLAKANRTKREDHTSLIMYVKCTLYFIYIYADIMPVKQKIQLKNVKVLPFEVVRRETTRRKG